MAINGSFTAFPLFCVLILLRNTDLRNSVLTQFLRGMKRNDGKKSAIVISIGNGMNAGAICRNFQISREL